MNDETRQELDVLRADILRLYGRLTALLAAHQLVVGLLLKMGLFSHSNFANGFTDMEQRALDDEATRIMHADELAYFYEGIRFIGKHIREDVEELGIPNTPNSMDKLVNLLEMAFDDLDGMQERVQKLEEKQGGKPPN